MSQVPDCSDSHPGRSELSRPPPRVLLQGNIPPYFRPMCSWSETKATAQHTCSHAQGPAGRLSCSPMLAWGVRAGELAPLCCSRPWPPFRTGQVSSVCAALVLALFYLLPTLVENAIWCAPRRMAAARPNTNRLRMVGCFLRVVGTFQRADCMKTSVKRRRARLKAIAAMGMMGAAGAHNITYLLYVALSEVVGRWLKQQVFDLSIPRRCTHVCCIVLNSRKCWRSEMNRLSSKAKMLSPSKFIRGTTYPNQAATGSPVCFSFS